MNTFIAKNLNKETAVLTRDGKVLEGITYKQYRQGVAPTKQSDVNETETVEEKKARLLKELTELE